MDARPEQDRRAIEVALVLQGGGALGAYEWGVASAVLELMEEAQGAGRTVTLRAVTGVSIGAINAACIVGSDSFADARARLAALWADLTIETPPFTPPSVARDLAFYGLAHFYRPKADVWNALNWTALYDTTPLLATLRRHVSFTALNASRTAFVVTAVDVQSGELTRFRNAGGHRPPPRERHGTDRLGPPPVADATVEIGPAHILASGSLAPQFPWVALDGRRYWDGGLVDNTPLGDAIDAFSGAADSHRLLVTVDLYPLRARLPRNLAEVQDRVHELSFGNRLRQDREGARRVNAMVDTLDGLVDLARSANLEIPEALAAQIERFGRYRIVEIRDIDVQDRDGGPEDPGDDADGLRDFSAATIERRRAYGYALAIARLASAFRDP